MARKCFWQFAEHFRERSDAIIARLDAATQRLLHEEAASTGSQGGRTPSSPAVPRAVMSRFGRRAAQPSSPEPLAVATLPAAGTDFPLSAGSSGTWPASSGGSGGDAAAAAARKVAAVLARAQSDDSAASKGGARRVLAPVGDAATPATGATAPRSARSGALLAKGAVRLVPGEARRGAESESPLVTTASSAGAAAAAAAAAPARPLPAFHSRMAAAVRVEVAAPDSAPTQSAAMSAGDASAHRARALRGAVRIMGPPPSPAPGGSTAQGSAGKDSGVRPALPAAAAGAASSGVAPAAAANAAAAEEKERQGGSSRAGKVTDEREAGCDDVSAPNSVVSSSTTPAAAPAAPPASRFTDALRRAEEAQWTDRVAGCETLREVFAQHSGDRRLERAFSDSALRLCRLLADRIGDAHFRVAQAALGTVVAMFRAFPAAGLEGQLERVLSKVRGGGGAHSCPSS